MYLQYNSHCISMLQVVMFWGRKLPLFQIFRETFFLKNYSCNIYCLHGLIQLYNHSSYLNSTSNVAFLHRPHSTKSQQTHLNLQWWNHALPDTRSSVRLQFLSDRSTPIMRSTSTFRDSHLNSCDQSLEILPHISFWKLLFHLKYHHTSLIQLALTQ